MNGELEFGLKLMLEKFEEDGPAMSVGTLDTKICDLPSVNQPCQGKV